MDSNKMMEELSKKGYQVEIDSGMVYVISEDPAFGYVELKKMLEQMEYQGSIGLRLKKEAAVSFYKQNKINPEKPYARELSVDSSDEDSVQEERETSAFMTVQKVTSSVDEGVSKAIEEIENDAAEETNSSQLLEESDYDEDSMEHEATYYDMNFEFEDNGQMRLF